jgi:very-short-patch-repair endonuclease
MKRLRTTPHLERSTVARARTLRHEMTGAERVLWNGLRECFRPAHFRHQVPFGPYYADFASHGARLVIEVDGGQHGEALDYDAARTRFMEGEGYRVLRFWNNEVLENLDGVLTAIASALPSPLVGEGGAKRRMGGARQGRARASGAHPHPSPPRKGEGGNDNLRLESD